MLNVSIYLLLCKVAVSCSCDRQTLTASASTLPRCRYNETGKEACCRTEPWPPLPPPPCAALRRAITATCYLYRLITVTRETVADHTRVHPEEVIPHFHEYSLSLQKLSEDTGLLWRRLCNHLKGCGFALRTASTTKSIEISWGDIAEETRYWTAWVLLEGAR